MLVFLHPKCPCSRATMTELERRKGPSISAFLDARFARFRGTDAPEDAAANAKATEPCDADA